MPPRLAEDPWAPLLVRGNPLRRWCEKEWWFADPRSRAARRLPVTRMPPLIPFLTDLRHTEFVVRASGRIRVGGAWRSHDGLVGVMEEHGGRW